MTRTLFSGLAALSAVGLLSLLPPAPALAGPHLLPRIHLPNINVGKAAKAVLYPVGKTAVNGGKTVLKTAETAGAAADLAVNLAPQALGNAANFAPSRWSGVAQKYVAQKVIAGVVKR